ALGSAAASLVGHPRRCLGLVPPGAVGLLAALLWALGAEPADPMPPLPCLTLGFMGGLVNAPLRAAYLAAVPARAPGNGTAVMNPTLYGLTALLCGALIALTHGGILASAAAQLWFLAALAALAVVLTWLYLFTPFLDLMLAGLFWPCYDI